MLTLTPDQFTKKLNQHSLAIKTLIERDLPIIIGKQAVDHFKLNFDNQGWHRKKWKEVQRREGTWERGGKLVFNKKKGSDRYRDILIGRTANLKRSIQYTPENGKVTIHSDLIYAAVHNFGLHAGRGSGFTMPQRQFIGDDPELINHITKIINTKLNAILSS